MLSRVLLGVVKRYRGLDTPGKRDKFIENLMRVLKIFHLYEDVSDAEVEGLVDEVHLKELVSKTMKEKSRG